MIGGVGGSNSIGPVPGVGANPSGGAPQPGNAGADGKSFGEVLGEMVIGRPSEAKHTADSLAARMAAGADIDPHQLAIATAKAGVEIQMATRTISSAVSAVRTLMQMQI